VTPLLVLGLLVSVVPAAAVLAFGLLLSVLATRLRSAMLLFVSVSVLFVGISFGYGIVSSMPIDTPSSPILPVRDSLAGLDAVVDWLSPFAYLARVLEFVALGAWSAATGGLLTGLIHVALTLGLATWWLRRRGVRDRGG
jgi:hypothetical protein